jgi:hypothetical protein
MTEHKVPGHLGTETRRWIDGILEDFTRKSHHFKILVKAAEAHERGEEARKILKTEGIVITDRFGTKKAHPAVAIERDARVAFTCFLAGDFALGQFAPSPQSHFRLDTVT